MSAQIAHGVVGMGLGGALMWTAVARNARAARPDRRVVLVHGGRGGPWAPPPSDHVVYGNNPDIRAATNRWGWRLLRPWAGAVTVLDQTLKAASPASADHPDRLVYKTGRHTVAIACEAYGIPCRHLEPRLDLTAAELASADAVLSEAGLDGKPFLCVEPAGKESFTPNKLWLADRWQELVDNLGRRMAVVQLGLPQGPPLDGVIDLRGKVDFRQTARVLQRATALVATMGGLVHLNKAVGGRAVVLVSGFEPLELATYGDDVNLYRPMECSNCGLKLPCPIGRECMRRISVADVEAAVSSLLAEVAR